MDLPQRLGFEKSLRRARRKNARSRRALFSGRAWSTLSPLSSAGYGRSLRLEPLEHRLVLSGESISEPIGDLADGEQVQIQFDVTVDAPFPKGDELVQNQATVSGTAVAPTTSSAVDTVIDRAPRVTGVFVNGAGWSQDFRDHLAAIGQGDAVLGYRIPGGADQLSILPWVNIDEVSLRFSEQIDVELVDLQLQGVDPITISGFNDGGDVGTWSLLAPLGTNNVRVVLDGSVTDAAGNQALDGEWIDGTAVFPSGDGAAGGGFSFRFNTVNGDGTRDGAVSITDVVNMSSRSATGEVITSPGVTTANYSIFFDVNADGGSTGTDVANTVSHLRESSPAGEPAGAPGSGWVAEAAATTPRPSAVAGALDVTKTVSLLVDVDGDGQADPGDTLRYQVIIANNSGGLVQGVQFDDTIDVNTTLVGGSLDLNIAPLAGDDAFTVTGNVGISVPGASGVLSNDQEFAGATIGTNPLTQTVIQTTGVIATTQGGEANLAADGGFTYNPPAGFEGADTFSYTLIDVGGLTDVATVTLTVGDMIWFIDNTAGGTGGTGTLADPFRRTQDYTASPLPAVGDHIHLEETGVNYTAGLTLKNNQRLIGEGATGQLDVLLGVTLPPFSNPLPTLGAVSNPVITSTTGNGVSLAQNNTVRGVSIGDTSGTGVFGASFGTLTVGETSITGAGRGISLSNGEINGAFDGVAVTSASAQGIHLLNMEGTAAFGDVSISGTSGVGVDIVNSFGTFTFSDLDVTTTTSTALSVISSGTVNSTSGTISTTTGRGVNIISTQLGLALTSISTNGATSGVVLNSTTGSFTVTGDGSGARNDSGGVILNPTQDGVVLTKATGVSLSSMRIDGVNSAGHHGISSTGGSNFTFRGLKVQNINGGLSGVRSSGWRGTNLAGVNLVENSLFDSFGAAADGAIDVRNGSVAMGSLTISRSTFSNQNFNNGKSVVLVEAQGAVNMGTVTVEASEFFNLRGIGFQANTISSAVLNTVVENSIFRDAVAGVPGGIGGLAVVASNSSNQTALVRGNVFDDLQKAGGNAGTVSAFTSNSASMTVTFDGNRLSDVANARGFEFVSENTMGGTFTGVMDNNTVDNVGREGMLVSGRNNANMHVRLSNNNLGPTTALGFTNRDALSASAEDDANVRIDITNNVIRANTSSQEVLELLSIGDAVSDTPVLNATVTNNSLIQTGASSDNVVVETVEPADVINLNMVGNTLSGGSPQIRFDVSGPINVENRASLSTNNGGATVGAGGVNAAAGTTLLPTVSSASIKQLAPTSFQSTGVNSAFVSLQAAVTNANGEPVSGATVTFVAPGAGASGVFTGGATATTNSLGIATKGFTANGTAGDYVVTATSNLGIPGTARFHLSNTAPLSAVGGENNEASSHIPLTENDLAPVVAAAVARWIDAGLSAEQAALAAGVRVEIADLDGGTLASYQPSTGIVIDVNAAGWGWFVDATADDDLEFDAAVGGAELRATQGAAVGRIDLLTVVMHELGHALGIEHADAGHALMTDHLPRGVRRLPQASHQADHHANDDAEAIDEIFSAWGRI